MTSSWKPTGLRARAPAAVKDLGRATVRTIGYASASVRMLPDFLIVGAQRCGTTSLFQALTAHPDVVPPLFHKGVHFFDTLAYRHGMRWYAGHCPIRAIAERRIAGGAAITGEASPYYLFHPWAGQRIAADLPRTRLVVLVRDPVERAFSAHKQETARGFETEPFEAAIELEPARLAGETERMRADPGYESFSHRHHAYLRRGQYAEQIARLHELVGRQRVLVLESAELFDPADVEPWDRLLEFLGLPAWRPDRLPHANAKPSAPLPAGVRHRLDDHYRDHDERLTELLGRIPSWRR
ncbi:MAG: sulfotransferase [Actinomycetes bacterium]